ncbi:tetratricopeptide repeat-containing serine/threonine protein kinase [Pendulispora rubella]|uniref:Tetratricopeptide repeat-containing serine/threonine protein kinase n=1 Tax=Pendulispora rubella TaxID=2741070 RepID=A0ABZ2LC04_9BACT
MGQLPGATRPAQNDWLTDKNDDRAPDEGISAERARSLGSSAEQVASRESLPMAPRFLPRGAVVGRYVVDGLLGEGGMGVVYAAYDPELDRKVALKMVRSDSDPSLEGRDRLQREAQAMARLSHPNVVAVHDIGMHDEQLFLAMEYIDGITLRSWLLRESRPVRQILHAFLQAGRGLAAAHASGLVHRDFKPDNVLCDRRERVCVTDFGIAQAIAVPPSMREGHELAADSPWTVGNTRSLIGTPAYMTPEQYRGERADASSDQFSFCVALYEGLYRQLPFAGETWSQLAKAVTEGRVREPPSRSGVAPRVHRAILRGLSVESSKRFASMDELLAALSRNPAARRWRTVGWVAAVGALAAVPLAYRYARSQSQLVCKGSEQKLSGVWDDGRKRAVHDAFIGTHKPFAFEAWTGVERVLDAYARHWVAARADACEATQVRAEQSVSLLDLRMVCFDERLAEMRALTDAFTAADGDVIAKAAAAAQGLTPLVGCSQVKALLGRVAPPSDAAAARAVEDVRGVLVRVNATRLAGKYADAVPVIREATDRAERTGYGPVIAEAHLQEAFLKEAQGDHKGAEAVLYRAAWAADAANDDRSRAEAWTHLVFTAGAAQARHDLAPMLNEQAMSAIKRMGGDDKLEAVRLGNFAVTLGGQQKYDEALAEFERARPLIEKVYGRESVEMITLLNRVANVYLSQRSYERAIETLERARSITESSLGAEHPLNGGILNSLGVLHSNMLRYDESARCFARALELNEQPTAHVNIGDIFNHQGKYEEARRHLERALQQREAQVGPDSPRLIYPLTGLGQAYFGLRDFPRARQTLERALLVKGDPQAGMSLATAKFTLARALTEDPRATAADRKRALVLAEESRTIYQNWKDRSPLDDLDFEAMKHWLSAHGVHP